MKFLVLCAFLAIGCQAISDDQVLKQWNEFQQKFDKSYKSPVEARARLSIFKENLEKIEEHNKLYANGEVSYYKGINQFADWTSDEFLEYVNKFKLIPREEKNYVNLTYNPEDLLQGVDWRAAGAVSPVKNQGQCGSCWSFSATGALEGQAKIAMGVQISLSEQNLVDCATSREYSCNGCNGGLMDGAFLYVSRNGIDTEQNYPYEGRQAQCRQSRSVIRNTGYVDIKPNEQDLAVALSMLGPASVAIEANKELQMYGGGILDDRSCRNQLNHGVLAIGYGSQNGIDYWIVKNSWGAGWGEGGYFRLVRGKNNCGIALNASVPRL